jgi:transposase-like protein
LETTPRVVVEGCIAPSSGCGYGDNLLQLTAPLFSPAQNEKMELERQLALERESNGRLKQVSSMYHDRSNALEECVSHAHAAVSRRPSPGL